MKTPNNPYENKIDTNRSPQKGWLPNKRRVQILEYIWQHGFLTIPQIGWLEGVGKRRAEELLKPLFDNGYVNRPNPKMRARYPYMFYWLTRRGAGEVANQLNTQLGDLDWVRRPSWSQIEHDASVSDFRIILTKACEKHPAFSMRQWIGESTFRSWQDSVVYKNLKGVSKNKRIYIDGYALVMRSVEDGRDFYSRLLIECEISPKTNPRFADDKILPQATYMKSEIYQKRLGSSSGRVLYLVPTLEKLDNFRRITRDALPQNMRRFFYFTTYEQVSVDSILFGKIWLRPEEDQPVSLFKP